MQGLISNPEMLVRRMRRCDSAEWWFGAAERRHCNSQGWVVLDPNPWIQKQQNPFRSPGGAALRKVVVKYTTDPGETRTHLHSTIFAFWKRLYSSAFQLLLLTLLTTSAL